MSRGGWKAVLTSTTFGHASASFLASEHIMVKRIGITLDADLMSADGNGNKFLMAGTAIGKVTASSLYGPYNDGLGDGREVGVGLLLNDVNLRYGDVHAAIMIHGSAIEARCIGVDANFKTDVKGAIIFQ